MLEFIANPWTVFGLGGLLTGGFLGIVYFAPGIGAWLLTSRSGRMILIVVFVLFALMIVVAWIFAKGREKERLENQLKNLEVLRSRLRTNDEANRMTVEQRKEYLKSWAKEQ